MGEGTLSESLRFQRHRSFVVGVGTPSRSLGLGVHFTAFMVSVLKERVSVPNPVTLMGLLARKCWMYLDFCHYCHQGKKRKKRGAPKGSKRDGIHSHIEVQI